MKKSQQKLSLLFGMLLFSLYMTGQNSPIVFVNKGVMTVSTTTPGDTALRVLGSMKTTDNAITRQTGTTALSGSFYHDAQTNAFTVDGSGWGTSTGTLVFLDQAGHVTGKRFIRTTNVADMNTFDRSKHYVAFPNIDISTDDTLEVPGRMGMDAQSILVKNGKTGFLLLQSNVVSGSPDKVYDASLRISGTGNSESLVASGSVVIERNLTPYRIGGATVADYPLFAFASPMKTMKSGYFAGNWIRRLKTDPSNFRHVRFVYGNEDSNNDHIIDREQYIRDPAEAFETGKAYLVKARPANFDYSQLQAQDGLELTDAQDALYDVDKFIFDGTIYKMQSSGIHNPSGFKEQVFAENVLFSENVNATHSSTINWVIGNSWTSAISIDSLVEIINNHPLTFEPSIYVYPAGSTTYQRYVDPSWNSGGLPPISLISNLEAIPSQSLFMVRVLAGSEKGNFTLGKKKMQVHSTASHNTLLRSNTSSFQDEVLFRVSPESNPNVYDLTAVGIRPNAKVTADNQDMIKMYQEKSSVFLLYSLSSDDTKLSVNAVPSGTKSVKLCLHPGDTGGRMTLTASRTESIEKVWLKDLLTNTVIDLKKQDSYTFTSSPKDTPDRFIVYFTDSYTTGINETPENFLQCYYHGGELVVKGLQTEDQNAILSVVDMQGRILQQLTVDQIPEMRIPVQLGDGIYIAKLQGSRHAVVKFKKGKL